jgi:hypothetical protein
MAANWFQSDSGSMNSQVTPAKPVSESLAGVIVDAPRSRQFKIIVGVIVVLTVLVLTTVVADYLTTGDVRRK